MIGAISMGWLAIGLHLLFTVVVWLGLAVFAGVGRDKPQRLTKRWQGLHQKWDARFALPRMSWRGVGRQLFLHRWVWVACLIALMAIGLIFTFSDRVHLNPAQAMRWSHAADIRLRLNEEKLAPPPALAPEIFTGTGRAGLESANRDWGRLDPDFAQQVLRLLRRVELRGYEFALLEGYRSPEQQDAMAQRGAHVTNARAWQSKHQFGLAVDLAPIRGGRLVISEQDAWAFEAYRVLGEEAQSLGLVWGGNWTMRDYGHIETAGAITAAMIEKHTAMIGATR